MIFGNADGQFPATISHFSPETCRIRQLPPPRDGCDVD